MAGSGVMRGTVTKMTGRKPHVEVPDLGVGYDFGPCETATGGQLLVKGQRVLVVSVGGIPEDLVVVGVLDDDEDARLDVRYYTKAQVDVLLAGKADVGHGH